MRPLRSSKLAPSAVSSPAMRLLTADCVTRSRVAVRPIVPVSDSVSSVSSASSIDSGSEYIGFQTFARSNTGSDANIEAWIR